jgi:hypothetical protein
MRKRWRYGAPAVVVGAAALWWMSSTAGTPTAEPPAAADAAPAKVVAPDPSSAPARGGPFTAAARAERAQRLALWRQRLAHAQRTLAAYQASTRYPYESRPAEEHLDQWKAHQVIANDMPLRMPGGAPAPGVRLHTTQQAVFASARDSVALTVAAVDADGNALPMRILRSVAHGPLAAAPGQRPAAAPVVTQPFVDDGTQGDARSGDGVWSTRLSPAAEGFGDYAGVIRTELTVQVGEAQGYVAFDVVYAPDTPATWSGPVRESLDDGSLDLVLAAQVEQPGRYVVTGRVDDATGKPFAYLSFNDLLGAGPQQVRLTVHGRLVRDRKPVFPLTLHDVEGFLLKPDAFPDRALMPPRDGVVHVTRSYALKQFSDAAWASDETARYLAEYGKDVAVAQQQVDQLASTGP